MCITMNIIRTDLNFARKKNKRILFFIYLYSVQTKFMYMMVILAKDNDSQIKVKRIVRNIFR